MDSYYQEWRLHEENDCMFLHIKRTLRIWKSLLSSYSLLLCYHTQQQKQLNGSTLGCSVMLETCTVLVVDLFCRWMLPMFLFFLLSCFGAEGMALPSLLYQGTAHSTSTPSPLLTHSSTTCLHSVVSLGSPSPLPFPLLSIMPSRALPLPWPIEGRMRKTERTSRAPHGAVCTITCTAFTCPVSTAVAPATVAKLACQLQPTLSAMPPSLNTCELAPTTS